MRDRLWYNLTDKKFKAIYMSLCSGRARRIALWYSVFLATTSASCVTTWAIWQKLPWLWTVIVTASQVLHITKGHLPFIKNEKEYLEMSFAYEALYLDYEKLWFALEDSRVSAEEAEAEFYRLRDRELDIGKMYRSVATPELPKLIEEARAKVDTALKINIC